MLLFLRNQFTVQKSFPLISIRAQGKGSATIDQMNLKYMVRISCIAFGTLSRPFIHGG